MTGSKSDGMVKLSSTEESQQPGASTRTPEITPNTPMKAPLARVVMGLAGWTVWSWVLFAQMRDVKDELAGVHREIKELRSDVTALSRNDVLRYEMLHWIELLRAQNPGTKWPPFPVVPD